MVHSLQIMVDLAWWGGNNVNLLIPYNYPSTDLQSQVSMKITDKRGIVISIVQIIVAVPIYLYHWRQARRSED